MVQKANIVALLKNESLIQDLGKALAKDVEAVERELLASLVLERRCSGNFTLQKADVVVLLRDESLVQDLGKALVDDWEVLERELLAILAHEKHRIDWIGHRLFKSPMLEIGIMAVVLVVSYIAMGRIAAGIETPAEGMSAGVILGILLGCFVLSFAIALVAVIAGIGGGVIFTPVMLAFTPINSLIIRGTGLIVSMFSGLVSTGPFMRSGLANLKLVIFCACAYGMGAFAGAQGALVLAERMGASGDAVVRMSLGVIVLFVGFYFMRGGTKIEWPEVKRVDRFTQWLNLAQPYYEESLGRVVDYKLTKAWGVLLAIIVVGLISGFFGMGGGFAIVPALNLIMGAPVKVASATSGVLLGIGDCVAVWPYLLAGAIIPIFVAPWLVGQVLGGWVGAFVLIRIKAAFVRFILIGILFFSAFSLITKGLYGLGYIGEVPGEVYIGAFILIMTIVVLGITGRLPSIGDRSYGKP